MTLAIPGALEVCLDGAELISAALGGTPPTGPRLTDREFAERYLKGTPLFPVQGMRRWMEPAPLHAELSAAADASNLLILEISRDFAKSTWTLIRILRMICENRDICLLMVSKNLEMAKQLARPIRQQLESNERLIRDYGPFKGDKWTDEAFQVLRLSTVKEVTLRCVGRGGQIVSARYDVVVLDDVEDFESTRNPEQLAKTQTWVERDVLPTVSQGRIIIIESPQAEGDLPDHFGKNPLWRRITRPAEAPIPDGAPRDPEIPWLTRRTNWPARWPVYWNPDCGVAQVERRGGSETEMARASATACPACPIFNPSLGDTGGRGCLTGKRFQVGSLSYRLQYLCDRRSLGGELFREEWFRVYEPYSPTGVHWTEGRWWFRDLPLTIVAGIDPAVADEGEVNPERYSKFGLVVLGVHKPTRIHCLLYYLNRRLDWPTQLEETGRVIAEWWPELIGTEDIAYQRVLRQELQRLVKQIREAHGPAAPAVQFRGITDVPDKVMKFTSLTPEVEQGLLWIGPNHQAFVRQAVMFRGKGSPSDLLDAYYNAKQVGLGVTPVFADVGAVERMAAARAQALAREYPGLTRAITPPTPKPGEWTDRDILGRSR